MDFKQLEAFVAVAKYGSFSKAARELFLTQPTISSHIQNLEKELDTVLFTNIQNLYLITKLTRRGLWLLPFCFLKNKITENKKGYRNHPVAFLYYLNLITHHLCP